MYRPLTAQEADRLSQLRTQQPDDFAGEVLEDVLDDVMDEVGDGAGGVEWRWVGGVTRQAAGARAGAWHANAPRRLRPAGLHVSPACLPAGVRLGEAGPSSSIQHALSSCVQVGDQNR